MCVHTHAHARIHKHIHAHTHMQRRTGSASQIHTASSQTMGRRKRQTSSLSHTHTHIYTHKHTHTWMDRFSKSDRYGVANYRSLLQKSPIKETIFYICYGVATISRLLKTISLLCRISSFYRALLQKRPII